ncbi:elongation of very long chain fatty acids protein 5-like [Galendromus occidentalis]|uniref:Elongation of very long chain fatty acids protein n=1 Tax=Galendromus occidentalis TaxID=34638 RepID=A0AAJ6QN20_9ACAR|nr:elongation of very long chain fatty acids protein 5-like [Galendromus occidentalis]
MESISGIWQSYGLKQDPRTYGYPLVTNPVFVSTVIATYLYIVRNGERWMEDRKPMDLRWVMRVHNLFMVIANVAFIAICFPLTYGNGSYSLFCQGITGRDDYASRLLIRSGFYYIFVRYLDFFDTFFFILKKKFSHVSNLHVIHHTIVAFNASFFFGFAPEGQPGLGLFINASIHVIMYGYYFMATFPALRKYLWWKKYLTQLQIGQFIFAIFHMSIPLVYDCGFPRYLVYFATSQVILILGLFLNFYVKTYLTRRREEREQVLAAITPPATEPKKQL